MRDSGVTQERCQAQKGKVQRKGARYEKAKVPGPEKAKVPGTIGGEMAGRACERRDHATWAGLERV